MPQALRLRTILARIAPCAVLAAAALPACTGNLGDVNGDTSDSPEDTRDVTLAACRDAAPTVSFAPMRRLTIREYDNTVRDLLGDDTHPAARDGIVADEGTTGFASNTSRVASLAVERYQGVAEDVAARAVTRLDGWFACDPAVDEGACVTELVTRFGRRLHRRSLDADEIAAYRAVYLAVRQGVDGAEPGSFEDGVRVVLATMLQAPSFLYRVEPAAGSTTPVALPGDALATRLATFLWESTPDDALLDAADTGMLDSPAGLEAEARRMLEDPRAQETIGDFHVQWLGLAELATISVAPALVSGFDDMRGLLRDETSRFAADALRASDGMLGGLFTATFGYVSPLTAELYGVDAPASQDEPTRVELDPERRSGILTLPSFLTATGHYDKTSPTSRGRFVFERILCGPPPKDPPKGVPPLIDDPTLTKKQRAERHSESGCAGCHVVMDPLGFPLEHYDAVGRFRTVDELGAPVDATSEIIGTDIAGPVDGAVDLSHRLADSADVRACVATQWLRFATGRRETEADTCTQAFLLDGFEQSRGDVTELLLAIVRSDAFRLHADAE